MKDGIDTVPMMLQTPATEALNQRLGEVQRLFHRSLACWASDVLQLRQAKMHQFTWRNDWNAIQRHAA